MTGTAICDALDALVDLWTPAAPDGWDVVDGQPRELRRKSLLVGWDHEGDPAVTVTRDSVMDYSGSQDEETVDVACVLTGWSGELPTRQLRRDAFNAFDVFVDVLRANPTLSDRCMRASVSDIDYITGRRLEGGIAHLRFTVTVEAFR